MARQLIRFFGIKRSGNHAVIDWIANHQARRVIHLNDIGRTGSCDPYRECATIETRGIPYWTCKPYLPGYLKTVFKRTRHPVFYSGDRRLNVEVIRGEKGDLLLIGSYENKSLENIYRSPGGFSEVDGSIAALIFRDARNLFASLVASGLLNESNKHFYIELFKEYCNTFISVSESGGDGVVAIDFGRWCVSGDYRMEIANKLGFVTDGAPHQRVREYGGGSSFSGQSFSGDAASMGVNSRWERMLGDPLYESILSDPVIIECSRLVSARTR